MLTYSFAEGGGASFFMEPQPKGNSGKLGNQIHNRSVVLIDTRPTGCYTRAHNGLRGLHNATVATERVGVPSRSYREPGQLRTGLEPHAEHGS